MTQLIQAIKLLKTEPNGKEIFQKWTQNLDPPFSLSFDNVNTENSSQMRTEVFPALQFHVPVINYWLDNFLYPKEAKEFESKLTTTCWDLCPGSALPTTGFSGTNDSRILLPSAVGHHELPLLRGTNGLLIHNILKLEPGSYQVIEGHLSDHQILKKISADYAGIISVIVDIGAVFINSSNEKVAFEWLELNQAAKASIFFDASNNITVLDRRGTRTLFELSPYQNQLENCLVYLDDSHTRGTDFKFPLGTKAAVTLGKQVTKDKLLQGCMRLRLLGQGHSVAFYASAEADVKISEGSSSVALNILEWSINNSLSQISESIFNWAIQGISYHKNCLLFDNALKSGVAENVFNDLKTSSIADIEMLYGSNRIKGLVSKIIELKAQGAKKELTVKNVPVNQFEDAVKVINDKVLKFAENQKRFTQDFDELQEIELKNEIEYEKDEEVNIRVAVPVASAYLPSIQIEFKQWVEEGKNSNFLPLDLALQQSTIGHLSKDDAWNENISVTSDFIKTVKTPCKINSFLRPVKWLAYSPVNSKLVCVSGHEANFIMSQTENKHVKLLLFMPRTQPRQNIVFNQSLTEIPLNLLQEVAVFAGSQYFNTNQELEMFLQFVAYSLEPRSENHQTLFDQGKILPNGFVPIGIRNEVFQGFCSKFNQDPAELVLRLVEIRNYCVKSKNSHIKKMLLKGKKPILIN